MIRIRKAGETTEAAIQAAREAALEAAREAAEMHKKEPDSQNNYVPVTASELFETVQDLLSDGYRLGQACCTEVGDEFEIIYSFDRDYMLLNLLLTISKDQEVKSITSLCWPAFIYENEIHDLFGVKFRYSELDYGGHFFRLNQPAPWNTKS